MQHWMSSVLMAVQVISSLLIIGLVLLQQGKGADMGSAFGGGSAGSVFGAAGAANFLSRMTKWAAIVFFASTGGLAWMAHHPAKQAESGVMQGYESPVPGGAPSGASSVPAPAAAPAAVPSPAPSSVPAAPSTVPSAAPQAQEQKPESAAGEQAPKAESEPAAKP